MGRVPQTLLTQHHNPCRSELARDGALGPSIVLAAAIASNRASTGCSYKGTRALENSFTLSFLESTCHKGAYLYKVLTLVTLCSLSRETDNGN